LYSVSIKANLQEVKKRISAACRRAGRSPTEVALIAVTKNVDTASIETAFKLGLHEFGENRVQEAVLKFSALNHLSPRPRWHMIGRLQSNKVKTALEIFDYIQSVDSVELAETLDQKSQRRVKAMPVLLQVNISGEASKGGFSISQIDSEFSRIRSLPQIDVRGLMTIAPASVDPEKSRTVFRTLRELRDYLHLEQLSMGMTDDFEVAIEEGASIVRIGRAIFGERNPV
jgi:pyridoxal phosphate enzyme (YggS family)